MTHFHVFLPPPTLSQLQSDVSCPPLQLKVLRGSIDAASQGPSLRSRLPLLRSQRTNSQVVAEFNQEIVKSSRKRRDPLLHDVNLWDDSIEDDAPGPSKRRSTRQSASQSSEPTAGLGTTKLNDIATEAPLPTLPYPNDITDSFLSLNTTTSNPSQLPPTAENRGDTSISNLPRWHIPLAKLSTLQSLLQTRPRRGKRRSDMGSSDLVSVLVCVTAVEAPVVRKRKEERATGREGTLWISKWGVVAPLETKGVKPGSEDEVGCDVKLWEECAREWGNGKVRRGDVVLLQGVQFKPATTKEKAHLVLSATKTHSPSVTVVYRTLPRYGRMDNYKLSARGRRNSAPRGAIDPQDKILRPDLRLGRSDAGIRKVAEVARWFAEWVGGEPP